MSAVSACQTAVSQDLVERASRGLEEPVRVDAIDLDRVVPVKMSRHAIDQWHKRTMFDRTKLRATICLVSKLESGRYARTRRSPYSWVKSRDLNPIYITLGPNIIFPAELCREDGFELEIVTCLTNPCSTRPLADGAKVRRRPSRTRRQRSYR